MKIKIKFIIFYKNKKNFIKTIKIWFFREIYSSYKIFK